MKNIKSFRTALALLTFWVADTAGEDSAPTYEKDVRPLLMKRCAVCHNRGKLANRDVSGGLALDSFEAVLKGSMEHKVLSAKKSAESELYRRLVESDVDKRMPLGDDPLDPGQIQLLKRWIDAGAPRGDSPAIRLESDAIPAAGRARRTIRTIDVTLPIDAKVSPNAVKTFGTGAVSVAIKVGPLPSLTALAFGGDGKSLAAGTHGRVVYWNVVDLKPSRSINGLPGPVHALAYSGDGKALAIGSGRPARSGIVRLVSTEDGSTLREFEGHSDVVFSVAWRPDDKQLASASFDQSVKLWDLVSGKSAGVFKGHSDFVYQVAYLPDGKTLLSSAKDRSVKRFDTATLKEIRTYSDHNDDVLALAVRADGKGFVSAGNEPQLRWWGIDDEKPTKRVGVHGGPVHQIVSSRDGKRLLTVSGDKSARIWDGEKSAYMKSLPGTTDWQYAAAISDDGKLAAAGGWDGVIRLWNVDSGKLLATMIQPPSESPDGDGDWLVVEPSGAVKGSKSMTELLRFKVGAKEFPTSPFVTTASVSVPSSK